MNPFRILWKSLVDVYDNLFVCVGMNVLWLLLSIPVAALIAGVFILVGLPEGLAVVLAPLLAVLFPGPGSIGIHYFMNQLYKEERVELSLYWDGLRSMWLRATALLLVSLAVDAVLYVNISFYLGIDSPIKYVAILWFYALLLWSMMCLYMNPLLVEQTDKGIVLIVRNAFLLCLGNAIPSLIILVILTAISLLSIGIAILIALVTGAYVATVETRTVLSFLERIRSRATTMAK